MDAKTYLALYSKELKSFKDNYFKNKIKEARKVDRFASESLKILSGYMEGGKNARGALTILGYKIAGGKNSEAIMAASFAIELIHNSLLIHDDFIDHDKFRHGKLTVHELYKLKRKNSHYGESMAVIIVDF